MSIIRTEKLTHVYSQGTPFEHVAIEDIDFEVSDGELAVIIGHTGSGKSTFIQHLNGLLKPTSGKVFVEGRDVFESKETAAAARKAVGLVFQYPEYQLFEETVYKDIAFGPKNMKLSDAEVDERVRWAADLVGLSEEDLEKTPFDMSGGQKRRAAIAGVIAMRPKVLIMDEPAAGLDPEGRENILNNIKRFKEQTSSAVIMVTHDMDAAGRLADSIMVLDHGRTAIKGTPKEVFSSSEKLAEMGLALPNAALLADRLRDMGTPLEPGICTFEQLKRALCALREGRADA